MSLLVAYVVGFAFGALNRLTIYALGEPPMYR